ncbi:SRPBCC family protein [Gordonia sp. 852002-10350_SCH5691597]|uniref:SRPBCC family protein n=1 Tax=Gordonia sp. 852002-10350_SCH5691597 TaxID=1834085 RepID=UPI0007EB1C80|nr:SRPBCC family protein [Gordonia sp. 852002-10350_SCH5691597]OBA68321.1 polyketide cyclase [Gordonia sp. 852002-10350_SCH5691597]
MIPEPTGRYRKLSERNVIEFEREFRASIEDVWAAVTESDRLGRWFGTYTGDPESGRVELVMTAEGDDVASTPWNIVECTPPRILQVVSEDEGLVWDLRVELSEVDGLTKLVMRQIFDDTGGVETVGPGWEYYLDRLVAVVVGAGVEDIDFDDYYPAQAEHYRRIAEQMTDAD